MYERDTLDLILKLQLVYVAIGVLLNVANIFVNITPRAVLFGLFGMAVHAFIVSIGFEPERALFYGSVTGLFIPNLLYYGVEVHLNNRTQKNLAGYAGAWAWGLPVVVNLCGVGLAVAGVWVSFELAPRFLFPVYAIMLLNFYKKISTAASAGMVSDCCWKIYNVKTSQQWRFTTQYIKMPDGKELACDTYLPLKLGKYPTMLHFTRYNRNWKLSWGMMNPVKAMSWDGTSFNMRSVKYAERFVPSGYAWVTVDVRGTGASGGSRPVDFSPQEVKDYQTVLQWVLDQDFCNGKVGSCGISYDGMAAIYLAAGKNPALKAIAPICFPYDVYEDMCAPGGIACGGSIEDYAAFVKAVECAQPEKIKGLVPEALYNVIAKNLSGVLPVRQRESKMEEVLKDHSSNWDMTVLYEKASGKDEVVYKQGGQLMANKDFGPSAIVQQIQENKGLAVYTIAAWYDAGDVAGAFKFHEALRSAGLDAKLTVGPWTHGCRKNCSPERRDDNPKFDLYAELVRFFDFHLKGVPGTAIEEEPAIHFWTVGAEGWRGVHNWPVRDASTERLFLARQGTLVGMAPGSSKLPLPPGTAADQWLPDYDASSGALSRWNFVKHICMQAGAPMFRSFRAWALPMPDTMWRYVSEAVGGYRLGRGLV